MRWLQTTIDKLEVFNVFQMGHEVYVIVQRPKVDADGWTILHVRNLETGNAQRMTFRFPDTLVEYVTHSQS